MRGGCMNLLKSYDFGCICPDKTVKKGVADSRMGKTLSKNQQTPLPSKVLYDSLKNTSEIQKKEQ